MIKPLIININTKKHLLKETFMTKGNKQQKENYLLKDKKISH